MLFRMISLFFVFFFFDIAALTDKRVLLNLLNAIVSESSDQVEDDSPSLPLKKVKRTTGECLLCRRCCGEGWYNHPIDCEVNVFTKSGEKYFIELMESLMHDISSNMIVVDCKLAEILPSFLLYFMHNAGVFPPIGEGYSRFAETVYPLSYFRDRPESSPIMKIYMRFIGNPSSNFQIIHPLNRCMFNMLKRSVSGRNDIISIFNSIKFLCSNVFYIDRHVLKNKNWQNVFLLLVSSGTPVNTFEAISSAVNSLIKTQNPRPENIRLQEANVDDLLREIDLPSGNSRKNIHDDFLAFRARVCDRIMKLVAKHKFVHIKPFHVKDSQNLMIEVRKPPNADKNYKTKSFQHLGWVCFVECFFCGLLNYQAEISEKYIYTMLRDSYGFLRPTLTQCGTAFRLSMGAQPDCYAEIVANALVTMDNLLVKLEKNNLLHKGDFFEKLMLYKSDPREPAFNANSMHTVVYRARNLLKKYSPVNAFLESQHGANAKFLYKSAYYKSDFSDKEEYNSSYSPIIDILNGIKRYFEDDVRNKLANSDVRYTELHNSLNYIMSELSVDYARIKYLLKKGRHYSGSVHFYRKSIDIIEKTLEDLSILNTIYYYSNKPLNKIKFKIIDDDIVKCSFFMDWGQQATLASIFWIKHFTKPYRCHVVLDDSSYYQVVMCEDLLKEFQNHPKDKKEGERSVFIYYMDAVPTLITQKENELFSKNDTLRKVQSIFHSRGNNDSFIILDTSSTPLLMQKKIFEDWKSSSKNVKGLIFVNSGNKNCQLGLDRYQYGQVNMYIRGKNIFSDFKLLDRISEASHKGKLLIYLKEEIEKMFGSFIY